MVHGGENEDGEVRVLRCGTDTCPCNFQGMLFDPFPVSLAAEYSVNRTEQYALKNLRAACWYIIDLSGDALCPNIAFAGDRDTMEKKQEEG